MGLAESLYAVDHLTTSDSPPAPSSSPVDESNHDPILTLLRLGNKLEAIKLYREQHGVGLREAKDQVERLAIRHGLPINNTGCLGTLAVLALGAASFMWRLLA